MFNWSATCFVEVGRPRLVDARIRPMAAQTFVSRVNFLLHSRAMKVASLRRVVGRFKGIRWDCIAFFRVSIYIE